MKEEMKDYPEDGFPKDANWRRARGDESRGYGAARKPSGGKLEKAGHRKDTDDYVTTS